MGSKREELLELISPDTKVPSFTYWAQVLDFFHQYQNLLDIRDMEILCAESERCRAYANRDKEEILTLYRNGKYVTQTIKKTGTNIKKEEVSPKVYDHLEILKEAERQAREAEVKSKPVRKSEPIPGTIPLAAAPG